MDTPGNPNKAMDSGLFSLMLEALPVAYVRPVASEKGTLYAVCTTDGQQLATFATRDAAYFAAKQHDLEPVLLH